MRRVKIAFIAVMGLLLVLPGLQMIHPLVEIAPLEENRRLMPFPSAAQVFGLLALPHAERAWNINSWFNDHMGFRPLLTRINNQVDYSLFGHAPAVIIGKDGWFFDKYWLSLQTNDERAGARLQESLQDKIAAIARYLAARNVKLVMVSIPASSTVYPEFLPDNRPPARSPSQFDRLRAFLSTRSDVIHVDGMQVLAPRRSDRLYLKTDHHFTGMGQYLMSRALVRAIGAAEARPDPWDRPIRFVESEDWRGGNFMRFLSIFTPPAETIYLPDPQYDRNHPPVGQSFAAGPPPFLYSYRNEGPRLEKLPPIVVFGNSFADSFEPYGTYEYFRAVYRAHGNGPGLGSVLAATPPGARYFVLLFIEPYLDELTRAEIPKPSVTTQ